MFTNKKSIIFITKSKIRISSIALDNKLEVNQIKTFDWSPQTLESVLLKLKEYIGDTARILLSEDFVYVVTLSFPKDTAITRNIVGQKAQELIPEDLHETTWDYRQTKAVSQTQQQTTQVVAVIRSLFENLSVAIGKSGINIETIEPLSYALARFTKRQDKPILFVYIDEEALLTLAYKQVVIATQLLNRIPDLNNMLQFIAYAKERFSLEPKTVVFCGNTKNINPKLYTNEDFTIEIQDINPMISTAYKDDLKGKDEDVLNIGLLQMLPSKNITQKKPFPTIIIAVIGCIVSIAIFAEIIVYKNIFSKKTHEVSKISKSVSTPTLSPIPVTTKTQEIDRSAYSISILNASGKNGQATKAKKFLEENGFNVVKTGNAEREDQEKTEIRFKQNVPKELASLLDKTLETLYDFSVGINLEENQEVDILIVIGKNISK